jgi:hypothetical protein
VKAGLLFIYLIIDSTLLLMLVYRVFPSQERKKMSKLIILTGPSGSGKSEVARRIAHLKGYVHHNIGDALARCLGVTPSDRAQRLTIGPLFLAKYGEQGYVDVLRALAQPYCILDGVRLLIGFQALHEASPSLLHIHKLGEDPAPSGEYDINILRGIADITVPWFDDTEKLNRFIDLTILPLLR